MNRDYCVKSELQLCNAGDCRVSVRRAPYALIIWRQTAPPRSLQSATQSSGSGTTLPAFLYTGSSAWAGDGVELSTLNKQGLRSSSSSPYAGVCFQMNQWWEWPRRETDVFLLCGPAVRKSALRGSASSAPEINPNPRGALRSSPNSPSARGNQIFSEDFLYFLSVCVKYTAPKWHIGSHTHSFVQHLNLQRLTKGCFMLLNSRAINLSIIKLE